MQNEKEIIRRVLTGDSSAFHLLVANYQRLVAHVAYRMISNPAEVEDICQDIFLKVYQNLNRFRFESKLSTWIAKIAYTTCLNHLQKKRVSLFDDLAGENQFIEDFSSNGESPAESMELNDTSNRLQKEIQKMPLKFRTAITLYHLDEMSYRQIGEIMNLPEGTVKSYLFRARKYLKDKLISKYQPEEL